MDLDLSVLIVNWNVCELLRHCLASIEANRGDLSIETIVVDNASVDDSVAMVMREFPQVHLIASQENLGYTGGNNLGVQEAQGRFILVLNPDTEIVGDALQQMVAYLDGCPTVGVVGPQLLYPDGSVQPSRRRFPRPATAFFTATPFAWRWFQDNRVERSFLMADSPNHTVQSVDWLTGAALMIRRETWQQIGPFDQRFFMYFEEVDWCHRCRDKGWEIHYLPLARIVHHLGKSAGQLGMARLMRLYRSEVLYFRKYFGAAWATVIRLFLLMNMAWELADVSIRWLLGRRSEARRQRMRIYWQALKSGLR